MLKKSTGLPNLGYANYLAAIKLTPGEATYLASHSPVGLNLLTALEVA